MGKLNVWKIIRDHFSTFRNYATGERSVGDFVIFLGLPLAIASVVLWRDINFKPSVLGGMLSAFSIFAGLLLNLLLLICGFTGDQRFAGTDAATTTRRNFLREVYFNLAFSILVAIGIVALTLATIAVVDDHGTYRTVTFVLTFLIAQFVLTIVMVLQRIHTLLAFEFQRPGLRKSA
jgi:hypothetical protein